MLSPTLARVVEIALGAGEVVLSRYGRRSLAVSDKDDGSPVTDADIAADGFIRQELAETWPHPILSEEGDENPWSQRQHWDRFWLVDPLDGTKDFLAGTGEFCVNIALIERGIPVIGVIAAPISEAIWAAERGRGTVKLVGGAPVPLVGARASGAFIGLKSRFHAPPEADQYLAQLGLDEIRPVGSALKFGLMADGVADAIVSFSKSKAWDIASGHLIAAEAGCHCARIGSEEALNHAREDLTNPPFIVASPRLVARGLP